METTNWISVKERLPKTNKAWKESDYVLCLLGNFGNEQVVCWYNSDDKKWRVGYWRTSEDVLHDGYVTHWMPLPDPQPADL